MNFTRPQPADPLDQARADLERATANLERIRQRVEARELDGQALTMAQLAVKHATDRWQAAIRGDDGGSAA